MAKQLVDILNFQLSATDAFKKSVVDTIWTINYWKSGKGLLERIVQKATGRVYDNTLDVRSTPGTCAFRDDGAFYYDPSYCSGQPYFEPTQRTVILSQKTYVYVFHELVHFLHYLEGSFNANIQEELRTVGLYDTTNEPFSENKFRRELNLPRRPCYCWTKNPQNAVMYEFEQRKRQSLNLPDQSLLGPQSPECVFSATN